ncbi:MAG: hypothetical protein NTU73_05515, partial [Ignavibacteriae bacterium]|nr:hypothetical protein [Ignavibacteriota bacterium]
ISDNDLWMSTNRNIIYHYNNSNITTYKLENGLSDGFIHRDNTGILYSHYIKYYGLMYDASFYLFKFENNNWIQINRDTIYLNSEFGYYGGIVNNQFTRKGLTGFYYFSGNNWVKFINTGNSLIGLLCAGNSFTNVLFHGIEEGIGNLLFYYNSSQIYRQRNYHFTGEMIYYIQFKFGRFYFSSEDFGNWETYLGTGTFKKTNLKPLNPKKNEKNNFFNSNNNIDN